MNKITLIKAIDNFVGTIAITALRSASVPYQVGLDSINSILLIRPGGIGDAVLLIPAIIVLKKRYPQAVIDVLAEKRNCAIFSLCPHVNRILCYDKPSGLLTAVRGKYDIVIDTEQWHRLSAVVARITHAPISLGYATNERKELFTHAMPYSHDDYEVYSFFNLIAPITRQLPVEFDKPFLTVPPESTQRILSLLQPLKNQIIVALFPGGSIQERRWGSKRFHKTAKMLITRGYSVVIIGGGEDRQAGDEIAAGLESVENFCGALSLVETAGVLQESALLITGDSGIMHVGFGLGIKTLSLFGPGIEKKWAPRGPGHNVINKHLACSPCTKFGCTPKCKKNAECMKLITVDEVVQKALELLEG